MPKPNRIPLAGGLLLVLLGLGAWAAEPGRSAASLPPSGEPGRLHTASGEEGWLSFPSDLPGYRLQSQSSRAAIRLFQGDNWQILDPVFENLSMSCSGTLWQVRWRSRNPDVRVSASFGLNDGGNYSPIAEGKPAGSGYLSIYACVAPALKFSQAVAGNGSTLVDVEFEYQVWGERR